MLRIYNALLNNAMSYADADRWAWDRMQEDDNGNLEFTPIDDEALLRELIQYLYGIDIPSMDDRNKTARTNLDIADFLEQKGLLEMTKTLG